MEEDNTIKKGLNSNQLKLIAIIAMTIDHITMIFLKNHIEFPVYFGLRFVGKITIPIMCFFISEGYYYTKNIKNYVGRLFLFAIISHFAFCYAFNIKIIPSNIFFQTSVIWSLMWGLISLCIAKSERIDIKIKIFLIILISVLTFNADWGFISVLIIVFFGLTRENRKQQMAGMCIIIIIYEISMILQSKNYYQLMHLGIFLSIPLLLKYNGQKGSLKWLKHFFYIYYPAHLIILGVINNFLVGK